MEKESRSGFQGKSVCGREEERERKRVMMRKREKRERELEKPDRVCKVPNLKISKLHNFFIKCILEGIK